MHNEQILIFSNPGEIDPRLITTLGVNVKEGASPIGFFGTGLKYALAVGLRLGCRIEIQSGLLAWRFETRDHQIRGKAFQFIHMYEMDKPDSGRDLGFTTELGKLWEPWMAYRELWCNAIDEQGSVQLASRDFWPEPEPGVTRVIVQGDPVVSIHAKRHQWFLEGAPLERTDEIEIYPGRPDEERSPVFYRGIKVCELPAKSLYTYNLLMQLDLTEDRTVHAWNITYQAIAALKKITNPKILKHLMLAPEHTFECELDWTRGWDKPAEPFMHQLAELRVLHKQELSSSLLQLAVEHLGEDKYEETLLTTVERKMVERSLKFLSKLGHDIHEEIKVALTLGAPGVLGSVQDQTIWLSRTVFNKGTKYVAGTILEEHLHIKVGLRDQTREMQNWLIDRIVSLGEELQGEPL